MGVASVGKSAVEVGSVGTGSALAGSPGVAQPVQDNPNAPKFGEVLEKIQSKMGAKPEKPREIKKTLGKDDFLRIMITQMQHQDPTNPFKAEQMAAEMAQFASVEQLGNINNNITKLGTQNQPLERMAMTNLIGKTVTVDKDRFPHAQGENESLSFHLPRDAASVRVALISDQGETVLEKDIGAQKAGEGSFSWDGLKSNKLPAKGGNYILRVEAMDPNGMAIATDSKAKARVVGVSFEGSEPVLLIGDASRQEKITLKSVVKIETDGGAPVAAPQAPAAAQSQAQAPAVNSPIQYNTTPAGGSNFFTFKKGEGSQNLDVSQAAPEIQRAIAGFQANQAQATQPAAPTQGGARPAISDAAKNAAKIAGNSQEKGFPNGLTNSSED